jgi:hypothetical protein
LTQSLCISKRFYKNINQPIMTTQLTQHRTNSNALKPLISGLLGITLLLPASFFMLTLLARVLFGTKKLYYYIAPSFLQSPFNLWAFHKAQFILGCLLLAVLLNGYRRHWLNTAIALQGALLLVVLIAYTVIQHLRY